MNLRTISAVALMLGMSYSAQAITLGEEPSITNTIDFNSIILAVIGSVFSLISAAGISFINKHMKDTKDAAALDNALNNALGVIQNAVKDQINSHPLSLKIPGLTPQMATGVQYVLDHAGAEAKRFGYDPAKIADAINARLGNLHPSATPEQLKLVMRKG